MTEKDIEIIKQIAEDLNIEVVDDDFATKLRKRREIEVDVVVKLEDFIGSQYARTIESIEIAKDGSTFLDKVVDDVMETSAVRTDGEYNDDDIKLAIGRTILRLKEI